MLISKEGIRGEACLHGETHKFGHLGVFKEPMDHKPGECVHTDHRGPYAKSKGGNRYSQLFLDMKSKYRWTFRTPKKTGVEDFLRVTELRKVGESCSS